MAIRRATTTPRRATRTTRTRSRARMRSTTRARTSRSTRSAPITRARASRPTRRCRARASDGATTARRQEAARRSPTIRGEGFMHRDVPKRWEWHVCSKVLQHCTAHHVRSGRTRGHARLLARPRGAVLVRPPTAGGPTYLPTCPRKLLKHPCNGATESSCDKIPALTRQAHTTDE